MGSTLQAVFGVGRVPAPLPTWLTGTPDSGVATTTPSAFRTPTTLPSLSTTVLPSGCSVPIVWPSGPVTTSPSTVDCGTTSVPGTGALVAGDMIEPSAFLTPST